METPTNQGGILPTPALGMEKLLDSAPPFESISGESKPWENWLLWITDAATAFGNGCIASGKPGMMIGAANGTQADTVNLEAITTRAVAGYAVTVLVLGYLDFVSWHKANPMPNPFRK